MERTTETPDARAQRIAADLGLTVHIAFKGQDRCPPWWDGSERTPGTCDHRYHGDHYRVTLRLTRPSVTTTSRITRSHSLTFDYWGSHADARTSRRPDTYDILTCVASDATMPTDSDEVVRELGSMRPSQAVAVAKWARRLQAFFTPDELAKLQEVDQ